MTAEPCPHCGRTDPTIHTPITLRAEDLRLLEKQVSLINAARRGVAGAATRTPLQMRADADMLEKRAQEMRRSADRRDRDEES